MSKVQGIQISKTIAYQGNLGRETPLALIGELVKDGQIVLSDNRDQAVYSDAADCATLVASVSEGYIAGAAMPILEKAVDKDAAQITHDWLLQMASVRTKDGVQAPFVLTLGGALANGEGKPRKVNLYLSTLADCYADRMASATYSVVAGNRRFWALLILEALERDNKEALWANPSEWSYIVEAYQTDTARRAAAIAENAHRNLGARDLNLGDYACLGIEHYRQKALVGTYPTESQLSRAFGVDSQGAGRSIAQVMHLLSVLDDRSRWERPREDGREGGEGVKPFDLLASIRGDRTKLKSLSGAKIRLIKSKPSLADAPVSAWQQTILETWAGVDSASEPSETMATRQQMINRFHLYPVDCIVVLVADILAGKLDASADLIALKAPELNALFGMSEQAKAARAKMTASVKPKG